jgi:hypothetical protein
LDQFVLASATGIGFGIIAFVIWIALAFWPARVAGRKGHSFFGFFIFSVIFFPAALIVAYVVRDRRVVVGR